MKTNSTHIGAAMVLWSFLLIVGIGMSSTVQAQYPNNQYPNNGNVQDRRYDRNQNRRGRNWDNYGNYGGSFDLRQTALNAGYNEGIKEGRKDRNNPSDFRNNSAYQKATSDYSSKLGDRSLYQRYYRMGYENGYNTGLSGN